ncbi:uncharacterized protein [Epargyreus clarus]|uniref:uncharacterized protein n=1 Tax=Epargyreus clarus TaxID=520877 RepID=UPI003C2DBCE0
MKIHKISEQTFSNATYNDKLEMLRKVEEKLSKAAKSLGKKGERYVKLIMKGIKARAFEDINSKIEPDTQADIPAQADSNDNIRKFEENGTIFDDQLFMEVAMKTANDTEINLDRDSRILHHAEELKGYNENLNKQVNVESKNQLRRTNVNIEGSNAIHNSNNISQEMTTEGIIQSFTPSYECESHLDRTCRNTKQMRLLKCHFSDTEIPIEKLCDGAVDCLDRTDEKFCTSQVTERVHNAIQVISEAEKSFAMGCFPNNMSKSVITTEIITFQAVLKAQHEFVEKYKHLNFSLLPNSESFKGEGSVKRTVNEISLVISALAFALDTSLCIPRLKSEDILNARKFNDLFEENLDETIKEVEWPPKSCGCIRGRCENNTCTESCKRVCYQKYSLTRWGCESINRTENVPMNVLCDGKFDCFDQSDEKDCVTVTSFAKFEANELFKEILVSLSAKIASNEYSHIRSMLLALRNSIENLQKICMSTKPHLKMISKLRNKCFSALSSIYSETLAKSSFLYETEEIYYFLLTLNENIVNALKRSHTGNTRIISNVACFCKNEQCSMPVCSRKCIRACIAEPKITRYYCENSPNTSVSIDYICNGEPNCPKEDDEINCKKDVCRRHHLSMLRRSLERIGKNREGTSMGELLSAWKMKVSSTLLINENNGRPNPKIMKKIVKEILSDLVDTYGAVEDYRRNNDYALNEFINIARHVMKSLKSCGI